MDFSTNSDEILLTLQEIVSESVTFLTMLFEYFRRHKHGRVDYQRRVHKQYNMVSRIPKQVYHLRDLIQISDTDCLNNLRMSRNTFGRLCYILQNVGGLLSSSLCLAHHRKNRIVGFDYTRLSCTISKHFNTVLNSIIKLHLLLLVDPKPITEDWHYCNRKWDISVNVLRVCNWDMKFIYVLTGWEGSVANCRVLRDAVTKPNRLQKFYLCNNGYINGNRFLTLYKCVRYHLKEWGSGNSISHNKEEFFNMKHAKARNVIERAFGLLKIHWAILRSASYYPIKVQNCIIMACCLIHNFIRNEMPQDPLEHLILDIMDNQVDGNDDYIDNVEPS
ncbi:hypothetical protein Pfo_003681 [Paulownia fortunei]|nr:hypothetical protein Pfo_003681 [Paulownia fortunei]